MCVCLSQVPGRFKTILGKGTNTLPREITEKINFFYADRFQQYIDWYHRDLNAT